MKKIFTFLFTVLLAIGAAQATTVTFTAPTDSGNVNVGTRSSITMTKGGVTVGFTNAMVTKTGQYRIYDGQTMTISSSQNITGIELTGTTAGTVKYGIGCLSANTGTYTTSGTTGTWSGSATSIVFTAKNYQVRMTTITVTLEEVQTSVATPTFSVADGTKFVDTNPLSVEIACETSGVSIYYTTDGTNPTASSTAYTGAITISETTTLKAIAIKDNESSNIATATYTAIKTYSTLKELLDNISYSEDFVYSGKAVVTYKSGSSIWIADETGYCQIYDAALKDSTFAANDALAPGWSGKYTLYNSVPEFINTSGVKKDGTGTFEYVYTDPKEVTNALVNAPVQFLGATASLKFNSLTWTENGTTDSLLLYNKFEITYPTYNADTTYDVTGIVTIFRSAPEVYPITITEADPKANLNSFYVLKAIEGESWNLSTGEQISDVLVDNDDATILKLQDFVLPAVNGTLGYFTFTTQLAPNDTDWTSIDEYRLGPVNTKLNFNANDYIVTSFDADATNNYDLSELNSGCMIKLNGNAHFVEMTAGTYDLYLIDQSANTDAQDQYVDLDEKGVLLNLYIVNPNATGIYEVPNLATISSVKYYNLNGVETAQPTDGVNIRVITYSDGTRKAVKVIK